MSDIYLSLTETPAVVTLSQPVISGALSSTVTVANTVTVALDANSLSALENVTVTVGAAVSVSNFPSTQTIAGTVTANLDSNNFNGALTSYVDAVSSHNAFPVEIAYQPSVTIGSLPAISGTVTVSNTTISSPVFVKICGERSGAGPNEPREIQTDDSGLLYVRLAPSNSLVSDPVVYDPVAGAAYINVRQYSAVTVGNSVTIGSLPAISGTVTVGASSVTFNSNVAKNPLGSWQPLYVENGSGYVGARVYSSDSDPLRATVTVGNSVTIGSLPAISGTVTARLQDASGNNLTSTSIGGLQRLNVSLASAATPGGSIPTFVNVYGGSDSGTVRAVAVDSSGRSVVTVSNFPATQTIAGTVTVSNTTISSPVFVKICGEKSGAGPNEPREIQTDDSGLLYVRLAPSNSLVSDPVVYDPVAGAAYINVRQYSAVTVSALPSGALTTRFGSVTTASVAQLTSCVTNTSRKYLLAQNISAGTVTIGIGFSPTTTQGIQLTAGAGLTFDAFCPTGAVYWLGAVTGAAFTILEA